MPIREPNEISYLGIQVDNECRQHLPIDVAQIVVELLAKVPPEDLAGLGRIVLRDEVTHQQSRKKNARGLYWPKSNYGAAQIELALDPILGGIPRIFFFLPMLPRLFLAVVLFHELGHHHHTTLSRGVRKSEREVYADTYRHRMVKRVFLWWGIVLYPFRRLISWINRRDAFNRTE